MLFAVGSRGNARTGADGVAGVGNAVADGVGGSLGLRGRGMARRGGGRAGLRDDGVSMDVRAGMSPDSVADRDDEARAW